MQQIMEQENPPKETGETAREVGGSPGPSSSLELSKRGAGVGRADSRDGRTDPQSQGLLWTRGGEERKDLILSGKQVSGGLSEASWWYQCQLQVVTEGWRGRGESQSLMLPPKLFCGLKERTDRREMGTKGQWREVNVFVFEKLRRGEHGVARATTLTRGDGEKQRGR